MTTVDTRPGRVLLQTGVIRRTMLALAAVEVVITIINLSPLIDRYAIGHVLDVNQENTFVVWLSSGALLAVATVAFFASRFDASDRRGGWIAMGFIFTLLSIDETASLHELAGEYGAHLVQVSWLPSLYTWVIVLAPFAAVGAVWMLRWFGRTLGWQTPVGRMAVLAILMWMTVPLFEAVDPTLGGPRLVIVIEESIEAAGEILMLWAVLLHVGGFGLRVSRERDRAPS